MYRLQLFFNDEWRWGAKEYSTLDAANKRAAEIEACGIRVRVRLAEEMYS